MTGRPAGTGRAEQPDPGAVFLDYRSATRWWRVALVMVAVGALLLGMVYVIRVTVSSPESTLRAYFSALSDRDADEALALAAPEVSDRADRALLSGATLAADSYTPPTGVDVTGVTVEDRAATAEVTYTVDGRRVDATIRLRREDGVVDWLIHRWLVVDAIGTLVLTGAPAEVRVNGQPVPAPEGDGPPVLPAFPGGYEVAVPTGDPVWEPRSVSVGVEPQQASEVAVPAVVHPAIREEVDRQIGQLLDRCAASTELVPPGCPFGYTVIGSASDVAWRIARYPNIAVTAGPDPDELLVQTAREGEAVITGSRRYVGEFEEPVPVPITGTVTVTGDTVVFHPGW